MLGDVGEILPKNQPSAQNPPRCRLAFRVGIVGNRALDATRRTAQQRAIQDLLAEIRGIFADLPADIAALYATGAPALRVVTSLAEGADTIGAVAARAMSFDLDCILPFSRSRYALDFETDASRDEYHSLLSGARSVFELDGSRADAASQDLAYEAASQRVLAQSDLVVALWTGDEAKGPGGTAATVRAAIRAGTPLIWINAGDPADCRTPGHDDSWRQLAPDELRVRVLDTVGPHAASAGHSPSAAHQRDVYFRERLPGVALLNGGWDLFRSVTVLGKPQWPGNRAARLQAESAAEWESGWSAQPALPNAQRQSVNTALAAHFSWADSLSDYFADQYRSTFVLIYLLGAVAVFLAVLGQAVGIDEAGGGGEAFKALVSLGTILAIIALRQFGQRRRWHDRWIDYRLLAEFVRQTGFLAPLCLVPPRTQQPLHRAAHDPGNTWMGWHARAMARDLGVISAVVDVDYLAAVRAMLRDGWIGHQLAYHANNASANKRMARRLQTAGTVILVGTIAGIVLLLVTGAPAWSLATAVLPAIGAGLAGIRSQAEMDRIARRSEAIAAGLGQFRDALDNIALAEPAAFARLSRLAHALTIAMTDDVLDWRIVFDARQLEIHV